MNKVKKTYEKGQRIIVNNTGETGTVIIGTVNGKNAIVVLLDGKKDGDTNYYLWSQISLLKAWLNNSSMFDEYLSILQ